MVIGTLMCMTTGLVGYLCFQNNTEQNILENFNTPLGAVFKMGLAIHLILFIPGDFVILRMSLYKMFDMDPLTVSNMNFIGTTLGGITTITICAIMMQLYYGGNALNIVVDFTGGVSGSIIYAIIPGILGMTLFKEDTSIHDGISLPLQCQLLIGFGSIVVVVVLTFMFYHPS